MWVSQKNTIGFISLLPLLSHCGGINENVLQSLLHMNTNSSAGSIV